VGKNIVLVIAGNKCDLERSRQVDEAEAIEYANSVGAQHITVSAKTGKNVEQAFLELTKGMLKMHQENAAAAGPGAAAGSSRTHVDIVKDMEADSKGGCC